LKLHRAVPGITDQVLRYRRWARNLSRERLLHLANSRVLRGDLESAFQRHFRAPLPAQLGANTAIVIIAESFDPEVLGNMDELSELGLNVFTYRFVRRAETVELLTADTSAHHDPLQPQSRSGFTARRGAQRAADARAFRGTHIDDHMRVFFRERQRHFHAGIVTFHASYQAYLDWVHTDAVDGLEPPTLLPMHFARQLRALAEESGEWAPVYVLPGVETDPRKPLPKRISTRAYITEGHRIVAYQRTAGRRESRSDR